MYLIQALYPEYIKNYYNSIKKEKWPPPPKINGQKFYMDSPPKINKWLKKHMKWCLISLVTAAAAAAKLFQSCPTLCNPIDGSPPGSTVPGILQARTLEWVAISFSNAWKWKVKVKSFNCVWLFGTPWTAAYQAPPSMGFSRQEYWSGVPLPSPQSALSASKQIIWNSFSTE